jgi:hypothetical protein
MKTIRNWAIGAFAMATAGTVIQAEILPGKYAPLSTALSGKLHEAVAEAKDARFWVEEYGKVLEDPDVDTDEKMALRKTHILEQAKAKKMGQQAVALRAAIQGLNTMPAGSAPSLDELKEAYKGLDDLGAKGRDAWDQLLAERDESVESLREEFAAALGAAQTKHYELRTKERATQLLLDAIDHRRISSSDNEFRAALKLPSLQSAAEFGFGFSVEPDDREMQAQTTLIALVGYSQYFWDHYTGAREKMGEGDQPSDRDRNIFGVVGGDLLGSEAIEKNERLNYFLSTAAKENFNRRLRVIWGADECIEVAKWNEERAKDFSQACEGLSVGSGKSLVPSKVPFELLNRIDAMIEEEMAAVRVIQGVQVRYESLLKEAGQLGDRVALSSAHYNAEIWAKDSRQALASFEAAQQLLDKELAASGTETWKLNARGIAASARIIGKMHSRYHAMVAVKKELAVLLE